MTENSNSKSSVPGGSENSGNGNGLARYKLIKAAKNVPDFSMEDVGVGLIPSMKQQQQAKKTNSAHHHQVAFDLADSIGSDSNRDIDAIINGGEPLFEDRKVHMDEVDDYHGNKGGEGCDDDDDDDDFVVPDGGWGWVVTFGAFAINLVLLGIHNCFAMLFYDLQNEFHESAFKTAWIGSIAFGCILIFAPVSGYLSSRFGCRPISLIGIFCASISLFVSSFAPTTDILFLTYGVGFGIGTSLAYTQGAVILSQYFSSKHALASGFMLAGSSSGTLFIGKIYDLLHEHFALGWRNILRVFSGITFLSLLCAATYKPVRKKPPRSAKNPQATKLITELSLWKNKAFMVWLVSVGLCKIGYLIPFVHLVKLATEIGYERAFGSNLLQWMGIAATVSRLIVGRVADMQCINRLYISQASSFLMGLVNVLQPRFQTYLGLIYYSLALGILDGGVEILLPVMTLELVGEEELAIAWGCILGVVSVSCLGPPIGGAIHDSTGSYDGMFYFAGTPMMMAAFTLALIPLWAKKQHQHPATSILSVDPSVLQKQEAPLC